MLFRSGVLCKGRELLAVVETLGLSVQLFENSCHVWLGTREGQRVPWSSLPEAENFRLDRRREKAVTIRGFLKGTGIASSPLLCRSVFDTSNVYSQGLLYIFEAGQRDLNLVVVWEPCGFLGVLCKGRELSAGNHSTFSRQANEILIWS